MTKLKTNFISELDEFLQKFDQEHPELSDSQKSEIKKHERIAKLRDNADRLNSENKLWEDF